MNSTANAIEFRRRGFYGYAWLEQTDGISKQNKVFIRRSLWRRRPNLRGQLKWEQNVRLDFAAGKSEFRRKDPNDCISRFVERDSPANDLPISTESLLPQAIGKERDKLSMGLVFFGGKSASELWCNAQERQKVGGDLCCLYACGVPASGQSAGRPGESGNRLQVRGLLLPRLQITRWCRAESANRNGHGGGDKSVRFGVGQRAKQYGVDHGEDCGRRADAECQCEQRHNRESRRFAQGSAPEAQVLKHCFQRHHDARTARVLLDQRCIAKAPYSVQPCLRLRHSSVNVVLDAHFQVRTQFVVQVTLQLALVEDRNETAE